MHCQIRHRYTNVDGVAFLVKAGYEEEAAELSLASDADGQVVDGIGHAGVDDVVRWV